jgi:hypothetical protein
MDPQGIGPKIVNLIYLAQTMVHWQSVKNTVMNIRFP